MPMREKAPTGAPCWIDLSSSAPERSRDFYTQLFGWEAETSDDYTNCTRNGSPVAGIMHKHEGSDAPDRWITYFASADAQATVDLADESGGESAVTPKTVGSLGTTALVVDPGGASAGIWQPGDHQGYGLIDEPGTAVWHELITGHYRASVLFYEVVLGWTTRVESDTSDFRFTTADFDGVALAGIMDSEQTVLADVPAAWTVYFGTEDVDRTVALAESLGGRVLEPAEDSPYGRLAGLTDPTGAAFKVMTPSDWQREPPSAF
jgi:predicted enzyme related to lactoylglutathione lyase